MADKDFQGYGAEMAREAKNWEREEAASRRECGAGGHDEYHEADYEPPRRSYRRNLPDWCCDCDF